MNVPKELQEKAKELLENHDVSNGLRGPLMNVRDDELEADSILTEKEEAEQILETAERLVS